MKKRFAKLTALGLAGAMLATCMTGCGGSSSSSEDATAFTWLIDAAPNTIFYDEYEENPNYKYWSSMEWDVDGETKTISIDFITPPAGAEKDNINTLLATGEYPDVMSLSYSSASATQLYEQGIALDLTDYIDQYMPNYKAWMEEHPEYAALMTNNVDGEDRYLQLYTVADQAGEMWGGFTYRRDWIVKYGTNPETGEAFTGAWEGDEWVDDVVFPSGNTDPYYISDWEWMFEIFDKALADQGITDGYACTLPYPGFYGTQDLTSGFGEGCLWYLDEDGKVCFGGDSDAFRAYIECMNTWYEKGWIDPAFDERTSDTFFMIDTASTYSGKVGAWYGMSSQLGDLLDTSNGDETNPINGIVLYCAPQPINDVYGTEAEQGTTPFSFYGNSLVSGGVVITNKAEDKDIAALLTAIDYMYSYEGGLLKTYGLSDVQQAEIQDEFLNEHGLSAGLYSIDDDGVIHVNNDRDAEDGLADASIFSRVCGLNVNANCDHGYPEFKQKNLDLWIMYSDYGQIDATVSSQLSSDQSDENSQIMTNVTTYMYQAVADFVTGRQDIDDDAAWQAYCDELTGYGTDTYTNNYNTAIGK